MQWLISINIIIVNMYEKTNNSYFIFYVRKTQTTESGWKGVYNIGVAHREREVSGFPSSLKTQSSFFNVWFFRENRLLLIYHTNLLQ